MKRKMEIIKSIRKPWPFGGINLPVFKGRSAGRPLPSMPNPGLSDSEKPGSYHNLSSTNLKIREGRRAYALVWTSSECAACACFPLKLKSNEVKFERITVLLAGGNLQIPRYGIR